MTLHGADLMVLMATAAAGCAIGYALSLRSGRRVLVDRQREMERRVRTLAEVVESLESRVSVDPAAQSSAAGAEEIRAEDAATSLQNAEPEPIAPELQAVITAAAVTALGPGARVRSAQAVSPQEHVSPWSQQGRVTVQSSHNLRSRR